MFKHFLKATITFLGLFSSFNILGLECPNGAYQVDVPLPSSNKMISFCQISKEGQLVKHGPEEIKDLSGKVIEKNEYKFGEKVEKTGLPSISESHAQFLKKETTNKDVESIMELFKGLLPFFAHGKGTNKTGFSVKHCPNYSRQWTEMFIFKKPMNLNYSFKEGCDIQGTIKHEKNPTLADLKLQNLAPFVHANLDITCLPTLKSINEIEIICSTQKGVLTSVDKKETHFSADYKVVIDPTKKSLLKENIGGNIHFSKIQNVDSSFSTKLYFEQ